MPSRHADVRRKIARRLIPRRVRTRLTLLYGALFTISGAALLGITYLLFGRVNGPMVLFDQGRVFRATSADGASVNPVPNNPSSDIIRAEALRQHDEEMQHLLVQSGIALAIMVVISLFLGWIVAGRVLRPLRTMTATVQQISARNLHERLAVDGPRDELKDLADTVDGLLSRLETALDTHKRFVANAAHELRTPLTVEHALLEETLIDRDATLESFRGTFQRLLSISEQRARLLESLLTLAGSERGLEHREPMELSLVADTVLTGGRRQAHRRGLRIEAALGPAPMSGDPTLIQCLVTNLIDNAIDYNVNGGEVYVRTSADAGRPILMVANTGRQVPAEHVARLFEPFQRLDRASHADGHHGLGLSIIRAIAAAHEAEITAQPRAGGGLAVEVIFPAAPEPANQRVKTATG